MPVQRARREISEVLRGGGLAVGFHWIGDRYRHEIGVDEAGDFLPLLISAEDDAEQSWPPSPPLQHLDIVSHENGIQVAFLVGMAGRSHWSASVELDGEDREVRVDVACRADRQPSRLATTYRMAEGVTAEAFDGGVRLARPDGGCRVELQWSHGALLQPRSEASGELAVTPADCPREGFPATVRWQYVIRAL